jgi:hypothetical protein
MGALPNLPMIEGAIVRTCIERLGKPAHRARSAPSSGRQSSFGRELDPLKLDDTAFEEVANLPRAGVVAMPEEVNDSHPWRRCPRDGTASTRFERSRPVGGWYRCNRGSGAAPKRTPQSK